MDEGEFAALPQALRFQVLARGIDLLVGEGLCPSFPGGRIPARMLDSALAGIAEGRNFSGHGLSLRAKDGALSLRGSLDFDGVDGYFVTLNESDIGVERPIPGGGLVLLRWESGSGSKGIPEGSFQFPLIVRTRRPGDRIALAAGSKAVDRLVQGWKSSRSRFADIAIVQDRQGLVAVLGPEGRRAFRRSAPDEGRRLLSFRLKGA